MDLHLKFEKFYTKPIGGSVSVLGSENENEAWTERERGGFSPSTTKVREYLGTSPYSGALFSAPHFNFSAQHSPTLIVSWPQFEIKDTGTDTGTDTEVNFHPTISCGGFGIWLLPFSQQQFSLGFAAPVPQELSQLHGWTR